MRKQYDAVVVGAGPAGSIAAHEIAAAGFGVLLLEKHEKPGVPLCCAEAVSRRALDRLIRPRPEWISSTIDRARLVSPSGKDLVVESPGAGYVLDRRIFDRDLAERVTAAGGTLACHAIGLELIGSRENFRAIKVIQSDGGTIEIAAGIFIAADGVESKIARQAGLNNAIDIRQVEALLQYRVEDIDVDPGMVEFHLGEDIAPGSYAWVFPKSDRSANIGLGVAIRNHKGSEASQFLKRFIDRRFGGGRIAETSCGLVPRYQGEDTFRLGNLLVIGDAARVVDSFSGAGIINGMISGQLAGQAAVEFLAGRIESIEEIQAFYPDRFLEVKREELRLYAKLRNVYDRFNDRDFEDIVVGLKEYLARNSIDGINAGKLLAGLIRTRPRLIRLVRHLL